MVSVIIPLFNVEKYILQCLISLEKQLYKNFEVVIVDDGCTDNSVNLVKDYCKNSKMNVQLVRQKNLGVSAARNTGIDAAIGDYICFVDADDMVVPQYLLSLRNIIDFYSCDIAICGYKLIPEVCNSCDIPYKIQSVYLLSSYQTLRKLLYQEITCSICSLMVKREILKKNKIKFQKGCYYSEDLEITWKLAAHSDKIAYTKSQLYLYRVRNGSAMSSLDGRRLGGKRLMERLENYFEVRKPQFAKEFKLYGTARWMWATIWQLAVASKSYNEFLTTANKYHARKYMTRMITYKKLYVLLSSVLFCICPFLYYKLARFIGKRRLNKRELVITPEGL